MKKIIAKILLKIHGWSLVGEVPKEAQRCVFVVAPHTSNWDYYYGMLLMFSWGIPVKVAIKKFWMQFPFGLIIKPLGGIGVDRTPKSAGKMEQVKKMAEVVKPLERVAFVIAPEGSRSLRKRWKSGFYHIAKLANVPIVTIKDNYENKTVEFGPVFNPDQPIEEVYRGMMEFYKDGKGKFPEQFSLDERYI